jgi:hypothetical protein
LRAPQTTAQTVFDFWNVGLYDLPSSAARNPSDTI